MMHPDVSEFDLTSHSHLPAVSVQSVHRPMISRVARDVQQLSHLKGLPSLKRRLHQRLDVSWVLCRGLSRNELPRRSLKNAQRPPPDAKRPSRVIPCQRSVIWCPTPVVASCLKSMTMSGGLEEQAREVARVQGTLAKRRAAKPATKTGHHLCRGPHWWCLDDDTTFDFARIKLPVLLV